MSDPLFGWDLTFKTVERDVTKKADVLVSFAHFNVVKRGFRCIGVGDERILAGNEGGSELLPTGWNDGPRYTLRYILDGKLYILNGLITDGNLILNLMKSEDLSVSNLALNVDDTVKSIVGSIDQLIPEYKDVMYKMKRDLIDPMCNKATASSDTQTDPESRNAIPVSPLYVPRRDTAGPARPGWPEADPFQIGHSDLDPFAAPGGGMIFDPFGPGGRGLRGPPMNPGMGVPGGLARGSVPPGARFDPFGPPEFLPPPGRPQPPPDSDHFPPPGNMFM